MRLIKFRAWDMKHRNMVSWEQALRNFKMDEFFVQMDDFKLMQYTGLKDKNGVEIYEGDIVEAWEEDGGAYSFEGKWSVGYDSSSASYRTYRPKYGDTPYYPLNHYWKLEVIGNIYENPELLEASDAK